ncbi:MAG: dihydrofolate reductase [Bacteroidetes bacterium]|jgi:dihydrofolate reductase|nr:dihydrofolate reductase [Bacteroidota bacterium]
MKICLIVAADEYNGIGKNNNLLCYLPNDLKFFKQTTIGAPVVMGRKTYESIGKPLPGRRNIVLSKTLKGIEGCEIFNDLETALMVLASTTNEKCFIIGGDSIYKIALPIAQIVYLTRIHHKFEADAFFPKLEKSQWQLESEEHHEADEKNKYAYSFQKYNRLT